MPWFNNFLLILKFIWSLIEWVKKFFASRIRWRYQPGVCEGDSCCRTNRHSDIARWWRHAMRTWLISGIINCCHSWVWQHHAQFFFCDYLMTVHYFKIQWTSTTLFFMLFKKKSLRTFRTIVHRSADGFNIKSKSTYVQPIDESSWVQLVKSPKKKVTSICFAPTIEKINLTSGTFMHSSVSREKKKDENVFCITN